MSKRAISTDKVLKSVSATDAGAIVAFVGTVRDKSDETSQVTRLELEAAEDLATKDLLRIAAAAERKFDITRLAVHHRIGRMKVGEVIVAIAVSAPHRKDAFTACRYVIDELKKTTPIWKKEFGASAAKWVGQER